MRSYWVDTGDGNLLGPRSAERILRAHDRDLADFVLPPVVVLVIVGEPATARCIWMRLVGAGLDTPDHAWGDRALVIGLAAAGFDVDFHGHPVDVERLCAEVAGPTYLQPSRRSDVGRRLLEQGRLQEASDVYANVARALEEMLPYEAEQLYPLVAHLRAESGDLPGAREALSRWWDLRDRRPWLHAGALLCYPSLAGAAAHGEFRSLLGMSEDEIRTGAELVAASVDQRLARGATDPTDRWSWRRVFAAINAARGENDGPDERWNVGGPVVTGPAATRSARAAAERRLGCTLPASYVALLRFSDGVMLKPLDRLRPVAEIARLVDVDPDLVDILKEFDDPIDDDYLSYSTTASHRCHGPHAESAIVIGDMDGGYLLLVPAVVDAAGDWEAWQYAHWLGVIRYPTLKRMLTSAYVHSR